MLKIQSLTVTSHKKTILKDLNLEINRNQTHILMGPNGSGKSTLASTLLGDQNYSPSPKSKITFRSKNLLNLSPTVRSKSGLFVSFQIPPAIEGLTCFSYLRHLHQIHYPKSSISLSDFRDKLINFAKGLKLNPKLLDKSLNYNFSGGETKKLELIQALIIKPKFAVFDEIDSGLDSDSLKLVFKKLQKLQKTTTLLIITHNPKITKLIKFDKLHILLKGQIVKSGDSKLLDQIDQKGYESFIKTRHSELVSESLNMTKQFNEAKFKKLVEPYIRQGRAGDWQHTLRVVNWVKKLAPNHKKLNLFIMAAYIHDIGWYKVLDPKRKITKAELKKNQPKANKNTNKLVKKVLKNLLSENKISFILNLIKAADEHRSNNKTEALIVDADNLSKLCIEHLREKYQKSDRIKIYQLWQEEFPKRIRTEKGKSIYPDLLEDLKNQVAI
jgi:Fe-S cluster assembly ATP-binding protein